MLWAFGLGVTARPSLSALTRLIINIMKIIGCNGLLIFYNKLLSFFLSPSLFVALYPFSHFSHILHIGSFPLFFLIFYIPLSCFFFHSLVPPLPPNHDLDKWCWAGPATCFCDWTLQDDKLTKKEILANWNMFVGSQATNYGEDLTKRHDEL